MAYERVNAEWPGEIPAMTFAEAERATRKLHRKFLKRKCAWTIVPTHGARWGGFSRRGFAINCQGRSGWPGWKLLVHQLSHNFARKLHPNADPHSTQHAFLEKEMIAHVVRSGWLAGTLKRPDPPPKVLTPADRWRLKEARLAARLARWRAKLKRAHNAIRKLEKEHRKAALNARFHAPDREAA